MSISYIWRRSFVAAALMLLVGCASTPPGVDECDPSQVNNVFRSASCGDAFDQRVAALEAEIAEIEEERRVTEADIARFNDEAQRLASDADALASRLSSLQLRVAGLNARHRNLQATSERQRHLVREMERRSELAAVELARVREMTNAPAREIASLNASIEAQGAAIDDLMELYNVVE